MLPKPKPTVSIFGGLPGLPAGMDPQALQGLLTGMPQQMRPPAAVQVADAGAGPTFEVFGPDGDEFIGVFKDAEKARKAAAQFGGSVRTGLDSIRDIMDIDEDMFSDGFF